MRSEDILYNVLYVICYTYFLHEEYVCNYNYRLEKRFMCVHTH